LIFLSHFRPSFSWEARANAFAKPNTSNLPRRCVYPFKSMASRPNLFHPLSKSSTRTKRSCWNT